eukprot:scaffold106700_cov39-Prasinocladus_malaysianus.AAC.1
MYVNKVISRAWHPQQTFINTISQLQPRRRAISGQQATQPQHILGFSLLHTDFECKLTATRGSEFASCHC